MSWCVCCRIMSYRRRPRTKVYDCNFNIGESYYKPVMDSLDRKYSARGGDPVLPLEREGTPSSRLSKLLGDREGTPSSRAGKLLAEMESNGVDSFRSKASRASAQDDDDAAIDAEFEETMKRIKASRAARNAEVENEFDSFASKRKLNIADQLLDSVGLNSRTQKAIEDDVIYKSKRTAARKFLEDEDDHTMSKWTAVRPGAKALQDAEEAVDEVSATARARKSRARLQDIDAELEELAAKGAARQKRIVELRALVNEDEHQNSSSSSSLKVTKRVSVKSSSEKKQVTF